MSFTVNLQCFENGDFSQFPRQIAWDAFSKFAEQATDTCWNLSFPDGGSGRLRIDEGEQVSGFSINRPGGYQVFEVIFTVLRQTPSLVYWEGGCAVADPAVIPGLPPWMTQGLGQPAIVHSGKELIEAIERS